MPITITKITQRQARSSKIGRALDRLLGTKKVPKQHYAFCYCPSEAEQAYLAKLRAAEKQALRSVRPIGGAR